MSDLIERLKGLQEWYSRNTGEGILHAVHLNALSEAIALVAEQQERIETLQTQRSYDASLNEKRLESIEELEELYDDEQKSADALLDRIEELEAKLIRANYLIDELEGHEGAEGWSEYLRIALAERNER